MNIDKPRYTREDLHGLDTENLIHRLNKIDNDLAWRIAAELFLAAHESSKFPVPQIRIQQFRNDLREALKDNRRIRWQKSAEGLDKYTSKLMVSNLNKLSDIRLSKFVTEDPAALVNSFYADRPLLRLMLPFVKLASSKDIVTFLVGNFELLKNPKGGQPNFILQLQNFLITVAAMPPMFFLVQLISPLGFFEWSWTAALLLGFLAATIQLIIPVARNRDRANNALALFISFTDEFVEREPPPVQS